MTVANKGFRVPTRETVTDPNRNLFDRLQKGLGMVPNLYAVMAHSETALADYLQLQSRRSSLTLKEKEVINLVVSSANDCRYCQAAHTLLAQKAGFTEQETIQLRRGDYQGDAKLVALAKFANQIAQQRGHVSDEQRDAIMDAGYDEGNVVDIIVAIGDKTITNYLHNVTNVPIDFPTAPDA